LGGKTPLKKSDKTSVVFTIDGFDDAAAVAVAGEFNDWEPASTPMKRRKDGTWTATLRLPKNQRFEYRFVVDGENWIADDDADALVPNPFGGKNSVVDLH
jgi:1,4-alpha-glucan branching enzyme